MEEADVDELLEFAAALGDVEKYHQDKEVQVMIDQIKRRIEEATKYADLDQLCLSPQCGFASTEEGNLLAEEEQWAKLTRIVDVAREVWGSA